MATHHFTVEKETKSNLKARISIFGLQHERWGPRNAEHFKDERLELFLVDFAAIFFFFDPKKKETHFLLTKVEEISKKHENLRRGFLETISISFDCLVD